MKNRSNCMAEACAKGLLGRVGQGGDKEPDEQRRDHLRQVFAQLKETTEPELPEADMVEGQGQGRRITCAPREERPPCH